MFAHDLLRKVGVADLDSPDQAQVLFNGEGKKAQVGQSEVPQPLREARLRTLEQTPTAQIDKIQS